MRRPRFWNYSRESSGAMLALVGENAFKSTTAAGSSMLVRPINSMPFGGSFFMATESWVPSNGVTKHLFWGVMALGGRPPYSTPDTLNTNSFQPKFRLGCETAEDARIFAEACVGSAEEMMWFPSGPELVDDVMDRENPAAIAALVDMDASEIGLGHGPGTLSARGLATLLWMMTELEGRFWLVGGEAAFEHQHDAVAFSAFVGGMPRIPSSETAMQAPSVLTISPNHGLLSVPFGSPVSAIIGGGGNVTISGGNVSGINQAPAVSTSAAAPQTTSNSSIYHQVAQQVIDKWKGRGKK